MSAVTLRDISYHALTCIAKNFIHNSLLVCTKSLQYMTIVIVLTIVICHDSRIVMSQMSQLLTSSTCVCTCMCTCTCVCTCVCTCMCVCVCVRMCVYVCVPVWVCTHICASLYMYVCMCVCIQMCMHVCVCLPCTL